MDAMYKEINELINKSSGEVNYDTKSSPNYKECHFSNDTNLDIKVDKIVLNFGEQKKSNVGDGIVPLVLGGATASILINPASLGTIVTLAPIVGGTILGGVVLALAIDLMKK